LINWLCLGNNHLHVVHKQTALSGSHVQASGSAGGHVYGRNDATNARKYGRCHARISEAKFREFVRYFALDLDAHKITFLIGLNRNTVNRYFKLIRKRGLLNFVSNHLLFSEK